MHIKSYPSILYFGTAVVLISTKNPDGTDNLAPMSSIFWLGWRCIIGLGASSQTAQNLLVTKEAVLNMPSVNEAKAVNLLARTTAANPVPQSKILKGYRFEKNKFEIAGLTGTPAETINASRINECPVQMEAVVMDIHKLAEDEPLQQGKIITFELKINTVFLDKSITMDNHPNRVDPDKWKPLIMSFQEFYTLGDKLHESTLAEIPENLYSTYDRKSAQEKV
ncbi:NADH-FMN oxidoreductase RutF, flavin reductase (DIM6/NTAB) family [Sphingobacterium nematocida]|uniref:NADH-FMN oxidoreductase RutF, flavin reductase (DIM6/NTAB) family n=1 Tax=Sphingobacterium nematocida TaxID=1513896 RepID=A0A1T5EIX0_9SPHI|nr:flavin reductase family protein [Sphingobacterium nematocida]SKB83993.1 NADH-FMN oxidoreductase RutF, flavin reductase (DIM6/NTAB) family [Sphingobacterium nematocida]